MTLELPNRTPAADAQPGFPVYTPDNDRNETPPSNPLGDYHKVAQDEPGNERELLFTIGGKPLYAPRTEDIDPGIGFRMIRDMRKRGVMYAVANAFAELLGDEAMDLLADAPRMSREEWGIIMDVLTEKVFNNINDVMPGGKG